MTAAGRTAYQLVVGWVWLLRLVCSVGTRLMGCSELGQVGWTGLSSIDPLVIAVSIPVIAPTLVNTSSLLPRGQPSSWDFSLLALARILTLFARNRPVDGMARACNEQKADLQGRRVYK